MERISDDIGATMELDATAETTEPASILVVEDDEDTAEFLTELLTEAGYTVTIAVDGAAALAHIESHPPDLVLMDLTLPGLDGYTVTERIRSGPLEALPIIMLTAAGQASSKLRGFDVGADDFVVKPFLAPELLARISAQLRRSRAIRTLEDQSTFLDNALELMSRRQHEAATSFEIERSMRNELLHSVNTHLESLCTVFDAELRRQPPGAGREALQRVVPRLRGAALVYQISEALTGESADFGALLRTIASSLKTVYSPRKRIPVSVEAGNLHIPSTTASPLAMIASELITNAFKHAFPHGRFGAITISCRIEAGKLYLDVVDDGVGFGEQVGTSSRGLTTVRQLVEELGGTFDLATGPTGTRVRACVSLTKAEAAAS
jgi:DNA-binding response OmpR family regulator